MTSAPWFAPPPDEDPLPERISIPVYKLGPRQLMPLRQSMIQLGDDKEDIGSVASGAGLGNDGIWVTWKGRHCYVRGVDIIREIARAIDPQGAKRIP